jgi:hypothetical protein
LTAFKSIQAKYRALRVMLLSATAKTRKINHAGRGHLTLKRFTVYGIHHDVDVIPIDSGLAVALSVHVLKSIAIRETSLPRLTLETEVAL